MSNVQAEIMVFSDGTPQPAPTPAPSTVPAPPTGVLATVGLLPRANGGGSDDVGLFNAKVRLVRVSTFGHLFLFPSLGALR